MTDRVGQPPEGARQFGNYRLVRLLGQGGFSQVYLGEHLRLETLAAIKVLSTHLTGDEVNSLLAEARTIARLEHPHIVRILDFAVEHDTPFLVMSYAPNGTLRQRYPRGARLPLDIILTYLKQIADALQYAHDAKLIHRDIKPENMLLNQRDEILLSDFGIAVVAHSSRSLGTQEIIGTVPYMAPEQVQGKPRPSSDQYALGVITYEWLCGSHPFRGTPTEVAFQHIHATPPSLREKLPMIPPALEAVVLKALEKDPHQRFASVREFAIAFEQACQQYLSSTSTTTPSKSIYLTSSSAQPANQAPYALTPTQPDSKAQSPERNISRRKLVFGSIGLAGLGATAAGIAWLTLSPRPHTPPQSQVGDTLVVYSGHISPVKAVAWSLDSTRIASAGDVTDRTVQVWNATTGHHLLTYKGHTTNINALSWSPDSKYIASASGNSFFGGEHVVQVWDATTGKLIYTYSRHTQPVRAVAWSPDGKLIASASEDKTVQVWDSTDGAFLFSYSRHTGIVSAVAWSHDGNLLASGSYDKTVQVWDAHTTTMATTAAYKFSLPHPAWVNTVIWSPDNKFLASASGDSFLNDDHNVYVWNAATGERILTYSSHATSVDALAWSPGGQFIASAGFDKFVKIWNATTSITAFTYRGHTLGINALAWSPHGKYIASASNDGTVRVWQTY
ncbi:MAG TPA: serine/threonine-protein kinase [Ktedonobacteraceae bacterium]|nr:serine/threonine-protein kinase [Ktedonobacteraceae bacterium]